MVPIFTMEEGKLGDPVQGLKDLNVGFNEDGRLKYLDTNEFVTMKNMRHDKISTVSAIWQYVQAKMLTDFCFEEILVPLSADCSNCERCRIYATKGCLVSDTLLVIIPNSGTPVGLWSRTLCIDEGLKSGTMLTFFLRARQLRMGVLVLNPYTNYVKSVDSAGQPTKISIPYNDTPERHILYVWDRVISRTTAKNILIAAYAQGAVPAKHLIQMRTQQILPRLRAIALTESGHALNTELSFGLDQSDSKEVRGFLESHTINWVSNEGSSMQRVHLMEERLGCVCLRLPFCQSKNTAYTNYAAMDQIFSFFHYSVNNPTAMSVDFYNALLKATGLSEQLDSDSDKESSAPDVPISNLQPCQAFVDFDSVEECQGCIKSFSNLVRRHHCQACGRVVCAECSKYRMVLYGMDKGSRVCRSCYTGHGKSSIVSSAVSNPSASQVPTKNDLQLLKVIGKGSFGKVLQVRHKRDNRIYALKILSKSNVVERNQIQHTKAERRILEETDHPFLCRLEFAFQTEGNLYLGMEFLSGGPLFYHLQVNKKFSEERARFYCAEVILGIGYLHSHNILYRDMKPENLLLDKDGHVVITDFGLSKQNNGAEQTADTICGTPEYVAPEVLQAQPYGRAVDWWSVGTLLYEMMAGLPPFYDKNRNTMFQKIISATLTFPRDFSRSTIDLITKLLHRNPEQRLGSGPTDAEELKCHPFFANIEWKLLEEKKIPPPWKPTLLNQTDTRYFNKKYTHAEIDETNTPNSVNMIYDFSNFTFQKV